MKKDTQVEAQNIEEEKIGNREFSQAKNSIETSLENMEETIMPMAQLKVAMLIEKYLDEIDEAKLKEMGMNGYQYMKNHLNTWLKPK